MNTLPSLTHEEWQDLHKRLTLYAASKARKLVWRGLRGGDNQSMPRGHGPDSLASEAIVLVIDGKRTCDAKDYNGLLKSLMDIVDSMISHLVESKENRCARTLPGADGHASPDGWHPKTVAQNDPAVIVADDEAARAFRQKALKALEREPRLVELFECLESGFTGRKEIAELLSVTEDDVTNLKKRLARKLEPLRIDTRKVTHGRAGTIR